MIYDKPYQDINALIQKLKNKGLEISDYSYAKTVLRTYSYFDLVSSYKSILTLNGRFLPHISIEYLRDFYLLDKEIQSLCMKYSLIVEASFKFCLADVIARKYGVHQDDYLDPKHYKAKYDKISFKTVKAELRRNMSRNFAHQPTRHYMRNHNHIPPWILFKNMSLGTLINLFKLLKQDDKYDVVTLILPYKKLTNADKTTFLTTALDAIRLFRNAAAHNLDFVNTRIKHSLPMPVLKKLLPPCLFNDPHDSNPFSDRDSISGFYGIILCYLALINDDAAKCTAANEFNVALYRPYDDTDSEHIQLLHGPYKHLTAIPPNAEKRLEQYVVEIS